MESLRPSLKQSLRTFLALLLFGAPLIATGAANIQLERAPIKPNDRVSLQRGAALFVNHCMGCHGASFLRYSKLQELGISEALLKENLMFNAEKVGDPMMTSMSAAAGRQWFGVAPPDLSLVARSRGEDWLWTYLRGFYRDATRPIGWNNLVFTNVGMPHVFHQHQGGRELTIEEEKPVLDEKTHKVIGGEHIVTVYDEHGEKTVTTKKLEHAPAHATHHYHFTAKTPGSMSALEYDQMVADVVNFLSWAGEPEKNKRFVTGVWVLAYLLLLFGLAYAMKRAFWKDIH